MEFDVDMLDFALEYRTAIDDVTSSKTAGLRQYELNSEEWASLASYALR